MTSRAFWFPNKCVVFRTGLLTFFHWCRLDDEARALHYYQEAHRAFPANMDVISWLGAFHVRNEVYEKAVPFFALAAKLQPTEVKWELMVASCHRLGHVATLQP